MLPFIQIADSYKKTVKIMTETKGLQIDQIRDCSEISILDNQIVIPELTFVGRILSIKLESSQRMNAFCLEIQDLQYNYNRVSLWVFDDKKLDIEQIYVFYSFKPIFNEKDLCVQFRIDCESIIAKISYSIYQQYFELLQISQTEIEIARDQLKNIPFIKTREMIQDPQIIYFDFPEYQKQKYRQEGLTLITIQQMNQKILNNYKGVVFSQYVPPKNDSYIYIEVGQINDPNFIRVKIIDLKNQKYTVQKYACGSTVTLSNLRFSSSNFNISYLMHDGDQQKSLNSAVIPSQSTMSYQLSLTKMHENMELCCLKQIDPLSMDRKLRKIKVDFLRCSHYSCSWQCLLCQGIPKQFYGKIICQNPKCPKKELVQFMLFQFYQAENEIVFQQFSIAIVQDLSEIASIKLSNENVTKFFKIPDQVLKFLQKQCLDTGERFRMQYSLDSDALNILNKLLYHRLYQRFLICTAYCDQYLAKKVKQARREKLKIHSKGKHYQQLEEVPEVQDEDSKQKEDCFDDAFLDLSCGWKYEWFEPQEDLRRLKVNLNGGFYLINDALQPLKCLEVYNVLEVDEQIYFHYLTNIIDRKSEHFNE